MGVTTGFHEDRHHIELEADRPIGFRLLHLDRNVESMSAELNLQFGLSVCGWVQDVLIQSD